MSSGRTQAHRGAREGLTLNPKTLNPKPFPAEEPNKTGDRKEDQREGDKCRDRKRSENDDNECLRAAKVPMGANARS